MAKHVYILPDCPRCNREMVISYRNLPPFTKDHPFGSARRYVYSCGFCNIESPVVEVPNINRGSNYSDAAKECLQIALEWSEEERNKTDE